MTGRQRLEAHERRQELFAAADWRCLVCNAPLARNLSPQLAHRVAQTKARLRIYGDKVMHHSLNLVPVCCLRCNDFCNIGNQGRIATYLLARIRRIIAGAEAMPVMREFYADLSEEFQQRKPVDASLDSR